MTGVATRNDAGAGAGVLAPTSVALAVGVLWLAARGDLAACRFPAGGLCRVARS